MSHPYHGLNELREMFLKFFETKGHLRLQLFPGASERQVHPADQRRHDPHEALVQG